MKPACFDFEEQFENWLELDQINGRYYKRNNVNYCVDCTPQYAERMRAEGRCAHPETIFVKIEDDYTGVLNESYGKKLEAVERKRLSSLHHGTRDAVPRDGSETRPVRFLRHIVLDGKRSVSGADDEPQQHERASEEDNRIGRTIIRA